MSYIACPHCGGSNNTIVSQADTFNKNLYYSSLLSEEKRLEFKLEPESVFCVFCNRLVGRRNRIVFDPKGVEQRKLECKIYSNSFEKYPKQLMLWSIL